MVGNKRRFIHKMEGVHRNVRIKSEATTGATQACNPPAPSPDRRGPSPTAPLMSELQHFTTTLHAW